MVEQLYNILHAHHRLPCCGSDLIGVGVASSGHPLSFRSHRRRGRVTIPRRFRGRSGERSPGPALSSFLGPTRAVLSFLPLPLLRRTHSLPRLCSLLALLRFVHLASLPRLCPLLALLSLVHSLLRFPGLTAALFAGRCHGVYRMSTIETVVHRAPVRGALAHEEVTLILTRHACPRTSATCDTDDVPG